MTKLELWRIRRKMSIQDLADKSEVNRATINRIEHNKVKPSGKTLGRLAEALNIDVVELIEETEETEQSTETEKGAATSQKLLVTPAA